MPYLPVYYSSDKLMAQVIPGLPRVLAFVWASGGDDLGYQVVNGIGDAIWCHGCIVVTSDNLAEEANDRGKKKKR